MNAKAPEGSDLAYLTDRARAYVVGLEARLKTLRQENDELRAKLADPSRRDEKAIRSAYARGWRDCAAKLASRAQTAIQSLTHCHNAALAEYTSTHGADAVAGSSGAATTRQEQDHDHHP